jgi:hypothetical protein
MFVCAPTPRQQARRLVYLGHRMSDSRKDETMKFATLTIRFKRFLDTLAALFDSKREVKVRIRQSGEQR